MSPMEAILAMTAVVGGVVFCSFFVWKVSDVIKTVILKRSSNDPVLDEKFIQDYLAFKHSTQKRLEELESEPSSSGYIPQLSEEEESEPQVSRGNMRNMLRS